MKLIGMKRKIKVIAFDADDTLWANEPFFQKSESLFCQLLKDFGTSEEISKALFQTEMDNLELYGYGAKGFTLSMVETALKISENKVSPNCINQIMELGKSLLTIPIQLLEGVESTLEKLNGKYKLAVATKGDLLDQQRKLKRSGIQNYFDHIHIMSDKREKDYEDLISDLGITPDEFLMVGNSLKSDIQPVVNIGGYGAYVPFDVVWQHEKTDESIVHPHIFVLKSFPQLETVML